MIKEHTLKNKIHKRTKSSLCPTRNTMPIISHWSCALIFLKNPSRAHLIIAQNSSPLWNEIRWLQAEALAISVLNHVQVSSFDSKVVAIKNLIDTDRTMSSRLWSPKVSSQKSLWRCIEWELAELSRLLPSRGRTARTQTDRIIGLSILRYCKNARFRYWLCSVRLPEMVLTVTCWDRTQTKEQNGKEVLALGACL